MHNPRDQITLILICFACILITGCITNTGDGISKQKPAPTAISEIEWMTIPITDAVTGKQTSIAELGSQGKPIIVHTFAVWCPACSMQLRETKKLVENNPDTFIILGIDIDPRENTAQVKNHIEKNKFAGIFVTAPKEFTQSLIQTVGTQVVQSLPQTIIISNSSATYIGDGVFPEKKLESILSQLPS
nr:redoxin family protein [uncultured Methanospirillum sp.]